MGSLWPMFASVLGTFLIIAIGVLCRGRGWLTQNADTSLAKMTANVFLPAYFFSNLTTNEQLDSLGEIWLPPIVGFVLTCVGFALAGAVAWGLGPSIGLDDDTKRRAFALCVGICNYGYLPLPLAMEFYPSALIDLILHNVGVDLALWSVGIAIIAGAGGGKLRGAIFSAPMIAVVAAIMVRQTGAYRYVPTAVMAAIESLGQCAIPLGLLLSGAIIVDFAKTSSRNGGGRVIAASVIVRLLVLPILILASATALAWIGAGGRDLSIVLMLQAAMPAAVFPIVLVRLYHQDTATALRVVLWTSVVGLITIPAWIAAGTWWLGI